MSVLLGGGAANTRATARSPLRGHEWVAGWVPGKVTGTRKVRGTELD